MGKRNAMFQTASSSVFCTTVPNWNEEKNRSKCSKPTQGLPVKPPDGVYCRKAICTPYMGQYLKTAK
jgi:hypothetical protein